MTYPRLKNPPIDEVVCGFVFKPVLLDAMDFGVYWERRRGDFPRRELHAAIAEAPIVAFDAQPLRAWMISAGDELIVQLQHDRFYMNWRRRETQYPRFSDHDGNIGLKTLALTEFDQFRAFCGEKNAQLAIQTVVLSKIDVLTRGIHYKDEEDLQQLLRFVAAFAGVHKVQPKHLTLNFVEGYPEGKVQVAIHVRPGNVRIESSVTCKSTSDISATLDWANERANHIFFHLLGPGQEARFQ